MTTQNSPYSDKPEEEWNEITQRILAAHPLKNSVIHDVAIFAWNKVWNTTVGSGDIAIRLADLNVPATVVGYFFEVLFAKEMQNRFPGEWRGNLAGSEKDLVCIKAPNQSVEIKSSGQLGYSVFGNRSYGKKIKNSELAKKDKSGFYITVNFYGSTLTLLRFGWIDASDWNSQKTETGQMASLPDSVYQHKLVSIDGDYQLDAPIRLLNKVGPKIAEQFEALKIFTIRELLIYNENKLPKNLLAFQAAAKEEYKGTTGSSLKE